MLFCSQSSRTPTGQSISFENPSSAADGPLKWNRSQRLPFDVSKMESSATASSMTERTSTSSSDNGAGARPTRRASALRRSSCTRSVTTSSALELMDAEICVNHVLVNAERERMTNLLRPLRRNEELDELARVHAEAMAKDSKTYHSDAEQLVSQMKTRPACRLGENVARGASIEYIHYKMTNRKSDFANMMDWRYSEMGMATAIGADGKIYLCQLYRG